MPKAMFERVLSPWASCLDSLIRQASESLLICSPFIGRGPCERLASTLLGDGRGTISVLVVTDISRDNMLSGATDVTGLLHLTRTLPRTEIRYLPNIHAKVYVADERCAVVTSANLTDSGLLRNIEYGFLLSLPDLVRQVRKDMLQYGALGSFVSPAQLTLFQQVTNELRDVRSRAEGSVRASLRREFEQRLGAAQDTVLQVRAESMSAHAAFADTILYVLRDGPKDTRAIYEEVQRIHPDLCDDTVKLVIRGAPWSQVKWHHRVRHAQLFLKRQGKIRLEAGRWRLVP